MISESGWCANGLLVAPSNCDNRDSIWTLMAKYPASESVLSIYISKERSQTCWEWMERYPYRYIADTIWNIAIMTHLFSREVKLPRWKPRYFRSRLKRGRRAIMSSSRCWPSSRNQLTLSDCSNNTNWFVGEEQRPRQTSLVWSIRAREGKTERKADNWDVNDSRFGLTRMRHDTRVHPRDIDGA